jgi:predicted nucleic acid-binding protein
LRSSTPSEGRSSDAPVRSLRGALAGSKLDEAEPDGISRRSTDEGALRHQRAARPAARPRASCRPVPSSSSASSTPERSTRANCATTATTIHYLAAKAVGRKAATGHLRKLLAIFEVAAVDERVLRGALDLQFPDFEDAVLHEAARAVRATAIVTRNGKDFARATLLVFDPPELLAALRAEAE